MGLQTSCYLLLSLLAWASAGTTLMDSAGNLRLGSIPDVSTSQGLVAVISSPGTPSVLSVDPLSSDETLRLSDDNTLLLCRGAVLSSTEAERTALATCFTIAGSVVLDGITVGDAVGLPSSRHGRTLTALFRARQEAAIATSDQAPQQTIVLVLGGPASEEVQEDLKRQVEALYAAVSAEAKGAVAFGDSYKLHVISATVPEDSSKVLSLASEAAESGQDPDSATSLPSLLAAANSRVLSSGVGAIALDSPSTAGAFVALVKTHSQLAHTVRAKLASWKSRTARGLIVDDFGKEATALRQRVLETFASKTRFVAGLAVVAGYRQELRAQLKGMVDAGIQDTFAAIVENVKASALKRLQGDMLLTVNDPAESIVESNSAALRKESFTVETVLEEMQVPELGLTKEKVAQDISFTLSNAVMTFPDSPMAQLKRTKQVNTVVKKEKKPSQRSVDLGLDLVAMLRPDGFGSLQGYAGYQLGGNSITFGVHNDADDPQTIAQFGGVRPPLLRVQPKLRVDVEL